MKFTKNCLSFVLIAALIFGMIMPNLYSYAADENVPQYRMLNNTTGEHFYTSDANERNALIEGGWTYEGITCLIPNKNNSPIYRLCNLINGDHHYTSDKNEKNALVKSGDWRDEGIGWYSGGDIPVYRLFNPSSTGVGAHHYTSDVNEKNTLVKNGWKDEGIGWYGSSAANFVDPNPAPQSSAPQQPSDNNQQSSNNNSQSNNSSGIPKEILEVANSEYARMLNETHGWTGSGVINPHGYANFGYGKEGGFDEVYWGATFTKGKAMVQFNEALSTRPIGSRPSITDWVIIYDGMEIARADSSRNRNMNALIDYMNGMDLYIDWDN